MDCLLRIKKKNNIYSFLTLLVLIYPFDALSISNNGQILFVIEQYEPTCLIDVQEGMKIGSDAGYSISFKHCYDFEGYSSIQMEYSLLMTNYHGSEFYVLDDDFHKLNEKHYLHSIEEQLFFPIDGSTTNEKTENFFKILVNYQ